MAGPTSAAVTATSGIAAGLMVLSPHGLSPWLMVGGSATFFFGCTCRTALAVFKKLNSSDIITLDFSARQSAMLACCLPLSLAASGIVFLGASVTPMDVAKDAPALWGFLLIMGLRGPEGFQGIVDMCSSIFSRFAPGAKKDGAP